MIIEDNLYIKYKHINILFQYLKYGKEDNFLEYLSTLTKKDIDINMKDEQGNFLIFFAVMINNRKILKKILDFGARVDILDTNGFSILYYPIKFNYVEIIDILLDYDKQSIGISLVNIKDTHGNVPIFYAIKYNNNSALQELLCNKADPNYKNTDGLNALHLAVLKKKIYIIKMITKYIVNIDAKSNNGSSALHYACNFQQFEIAKYLLESGANPNEIEIEYGFTPFFYAVVQNDVSIIKILLDYNINPNNQDYTGNTAISYAVMYTYDEILHLILNKYNIKKKTYEVFSENINNQGKDEDAFYIDPNLVNTDGLTLLHIFLYNYKENYSEYLNKLLPYSNLNYQDNMGNTPLHIMADKKIIIPYSQILEKKKMNMFIKNYQGFTVFDYIDSYEKKQILNIIANSYYNQLQKYQNDWKLKWENNCSLSGIEKKEECINQIIKCMNTKNFSIPTKKNKKIITIDEDALVNIGTFTGSMLDILVGFKYLVKKYSYASTLIHYNRNTSKELIEYSHTLGIQDNPHQHILQFEIRWIYQQIFFPPNFDTLISNLINNKKYKYIIIPIGIILSNGNHSNGLFFDIHNLIIERFEPHGSDYPFQFNYNPNLLDEHLQKKFNHIISTNNENIINIKYLSPKNYLPKLGFQNIESSEININKNIGDPNGFCALWVIWFFDYRLKYFDIPPNKIFNKLVMQIKYNNLSFRTIIRNYSKKITDLRDFYLQKINKNINDYINNRLLDDDIKKLLIEILIDND